MYLGVKFFTRGQYFVVTFCVRLAVLQVASIVLAKEAESEPTRYISLAKQLVLAARGNLTSKGWRTAADEQVCFGAYMHACVCACVRGPQPLFSFSSFCSPPLTWLCLQV